MRLLDLFCGAGGASMGYYRGGFTEIVGLDIEPQPNYPFEFIQGDALKADFAGFDLIHASPPCQRWSTASGKSNKSAIYPDLLRPIRAKLQLSGMKYVIENVQEAPLYDPVILCGTMFPKLRVIRHRGFECSFYVPTPPKFCHNHPEIYNSKKPHLNPETSYITVAGGGNCSLLNQKRAMNITWMNKNELSQAIPPDYTQYLSTFFVP